MSEEEDPLIKLSVFGLEAQMTQTPIYKQRETGNVTRFSRLGWKARADRSHCHEWFDSNRDNAKLPDVVGRVLTHKSRNTMKVKSYSEPRAPEQVSFSGSSA